MSITNSRSLLKLMSIKSVVPSNHLNFCPHLLLLHSTSSPFPETRSFPLNQFFLPGSQSIGASASASVLSVNIQDLFPLGLTGLSPCSPRDSQESSPATQFEIIDSSVLRLLYVPLISFHDNWKNYRLNYMHFCRQSNIFAF